MNKNQFQLFLVIVIVCSFSCKQKEQATFQNKILSQRLLNKTESFNVEGVNTYKINYESNGLTIEGFIAKPTLIKSKEKLPAIIFCRGGNQSFGLLNAFQLRMINQLAAKGFVVLASQLRGNTTSEGVDEFGGKDVNDILNLIEIAKDIDFIASKNIHVLGYSRGGMNTYQVSKLTDNINSIAVVGGSTNKFKAIKYRESMYYNVYVPLFGDTIQNKNEYIKRSPIFWHNALNEPLLILHGANDYRVSVEEAQQMIDSLLISNKKDFKFKIFNAGNHPLSNYSEERDSLIINWFKIHNK